MNMMGMCALSGSDFSMRAILNPDISPIITSRRMRLNSFSPLFSGECMVSRASSAELAVTTS